MFAAPTDLSGHWTGTGTARDASDWTTPCTSISLDLDVTEQSVSIRALEETCGLLEARWTPVTMELRGSDFFSEGKKVGHFTENRLYVFANTNPRDGSYVELSLELVDGKLQIIDTIGNRQGALVVSGELRR